MGPGLGASGRKRRRFALLVAALALLEAGCAPDTGLSAPAGAAARPARLVTLSSGRKINLDCRGHGAPTVVFESGYGADSRAWDKVRRQLGPGAPRTCAYDRAGYGFSDPAPAPRDGAAIARDLDEALTTAGEEGPFILVGHSAGGLYMRIFATRRVKDVDGLVLVDPTIEQIAPPGVQDGLGGIRRKAEHCLALARANPRPPPVDPLWAECISPQDDAHSREVKLRPATWETRLSELNELFGRTSEQAFRTRGLLNYVPAYVLTASDTAAAAPQVGYDKPQSLWEVRHVLLAGTFLRGWQRTVLSSHLIMIDRPEVVAEAVMSMVRASRAGQPPEGMPASETEKPEQEAFPTTEPPETK